MKITHCFKDGTTAETVNGHRLNQEKTQTIMTIMKEVQIEKKSNRDNRGGNHGHHAC